MGAGTSKTESSVIVNSKIPLFCLKKLGPNQILVAGGGGESKTGVSNLIQNYLLTYEYAKDSKSPATVKALLVDTIDTDIYATMNMDVVCCSNPEKGRYLLAAGHGQYCDIYETTGYESRKDGDDDGETRLLKMKSVGRLTTSEKVESFQKCVRFNRATAGKRVVTGGEDGHVRVWDVKALVEDRNPEILREPILDIEAHETDVFDIDISSDGRLIISVGHDGVAKIWDMALGTHIGDVPMPTECCTGYKVRSVRCLSQGSGSNMVFVAAYNAVSLTSKRKSYLALWAYNQESQKLRTVVVRSIGHGDAVASLCVSSCGNYTGLGTMGGSVYIYDTYELKELIAFKEAHGIFVTAVEFLEGSASDVTASIPSTSGAQVKTPTPTRHSRASLVSLSADQTVQVHDLPVEKRSQAKFLFKVFLLSLIAYYLIWCLLSMYFPHILSDQSSHTVPE